MESYRERYKKCVVPGCMDLFSKKHTFPKNDTILFHKWINQVQNPLLENKSHNQIYKTYTVCDLHFSDFDKVPGTKRGLRKTAFPTKLLPGCTAEGTSTESQPWEPPRDEEGASTESQPAEPPRDEKCLSERISLKLKTFLTPKMSLLSEEPIKTDQLGNLPRTPTPRTLKYFDIDLHTVENIEPSTPKPSQKSKRRILNSVNVTRQSELTPKAKKLYKAVINWDGIQYIKSDNLLPPSPQIKDPDTILMQEDFITLPQANRQTQTTIFSSPYSPRELKMKKAIKKLQNENYKLKQILKKEETYSNSDSSQENLSFSTELTYKCPSGSTYEDILIEPQSSISQEGSMEGVEFFVDADNIDDNEESVISYNSNTEERYCRLCFNLVNRDATVPLDDPIDTSSSKSKCSENDSESDKVTKIIHMCLPFYEALIADPVICNRCVVNLRKYHDFRMSCLKNQELIENCIQINGTNNQPYNLGEMIQAKFKKIDATDSQKEFMTSAGDAQEFEEGPCCDEGFLAESNYAPQTLQVQNNFEADEDIASNKIIFSQLHLLNEPIMEETSSSDCKVEKQQVCTDEQNELDQENFLSIKIEPKQETLLTDGIDYAQDTENVTVDNYMDIAKDITVEFTER